MITLYDNPFSPFARKVRMVLAYKGLAATSVDALALAHLDALHAVNGRAEVPVLVDGDVTVVNSADIVAYLDHRYPTQPVLPADPAERVAARMWERLADVTFDAIVHDISIWTWPTHCRDDRPPDGLLDAGMRGIAEILGRMESALPGRDFLCGAPSVADFALFPHVSSLKPMGIGLDDHPHVAAWNRRVHELPAVRQDLAYVRQAAREKFVDGPSPYEGERIVWRGDRIEWLFDAGFADWWYDEHRAGRAVTPGRH